MPLILPYSFPKAVSEEPDSGLSKEAQVSKNLELDRHWVEVSPKQTTEPYVKTFRNTKIPESMILRGDNPVDDVLAESHQEISRYTVQLPYSKAPESTNMNSRATNSLLLSRKRSRNVLEPISQRQLDSSTNVAVYSGKSKTPTRNPIRVLSLSLKKPNLHESSPASERAIVKQIFVRSEKDGDDANKSMGDPLACHAENIMRMAMDSTMLGSFYNNSFSSTFSNLADDSVLGKKYPDILGESEKSITEHRPAAPLLAKLRAQKVEISAADLQEAVNGDIR